MSGSRYQGRTNSLPQYVRDIARLCAVRVDSDSPGMLASDDVRKALAGAPRLYLRTYVLPLLEALAAGQVPLWMREANERDLQNMRRRYAEAERELDRAVTLEGPTP